MALEYIQCEYIRISETWSESEIRIYEPTGYVLKPSTTCYDEQAKYVEALHVKYLHLHGFFIVEDTQCGYSMYLSTHACLMRYVPTTLP